MDTFTLHVRTYHADATILHVDQFVQRGFSETDLMKPRSTVQRWMNEMGIELKNVTNMVLVIQKDGVDQVFTRYSGVKLTWRPISLFKREV